MIVRATVDTPIGRLTLIASEGGLREIRFPIEVATDAPEDGDDGVLEAARRQLGEYFDGSRRDFALPLDLHGTDFQLAAWRALLQIPYGTTVSYGEQARRLGDVGKARAVGHANGRNPLPIVVPCHRVIGANGSLTGFGGGLDTKRWLLAHERDILDGTPRLPLG